jgi:hypothetical protein
MESFQGIYEDGIVRFPSPIALPEHTKVVVTAETASPNAGKSEGGGAGEAQPSGIGSNSEKLYALLSERFNSGFTDTAARHNEHQP